MRPTPPTFIAHCAFPGLLALLLGGCATLPPPTRDELQAQALGQVAVPGHWSGAPAEVADTAPLGPEATAWLASFDDPQLIALAGEAVARNPDLLVAAARVEQAEAAVAMAEAQLKPGLGLLARTSTKPVDDLVAVVSGLVLKVWWEIDLWGRMRYARNAALLPARRLARIIDSPSNRLPQLPPAPGSWPSKPARSASSANSWWKILRWWRPWPGNERRLGREASVS